MDMMLYLSIELLNHHRIEFGVTEYRIGESEICVDAVKVDR